MNDFSKSAEPVLSSTMLLLKGEDAPTVLMVKRHYQIDFASGAMVFPGGKVSADDHRDDWDGWYHGTYSDDELAARIGGVREVFEESGILLATRKGDTAGKFVGQSVCNELAEFRSPVDRGEMSFLELVQKYELQLDLTDLQPYAHWITPDFMPKRFDTRFYVARAPDGQEALHDGRETTEAVWVTPTEVLEKAEAGEAKLLFPTRVNLERLEDLGSVSAICEFAQPENVVTVLPVVESDETGKFLRIPKAAGYRVTTEPLERVMKTV